MKRPTGILLAAVALFSAFQFTSVAIGPGRNDADARLTSFGISLAFLIWIVADARSRRRTPCFDFGFLVAVYFPFSLVWYVVWSRGWRGLLVLAGFFGLMLLPSLSAVVAWIIRYGVA